MVKTILISSFSWGAMLFLFLRPSILSQTPLFLIYQNDRYGYINEKGDVVIEPKFLSANDFSDGLASVRLNGKYGFINEKGSFAIESNFDYASQFIQGMTVVFKDGDPLFIDKNGKVIFPTVYKSLSLLDSRKGIVTTISNKMGLLDIKSNELIIDTAFSSISDFSNGVAIVREYISPEITRKENRVAVIDTNGNFVVPYGRYLSIKPFYDGIAVVEIHDKRNKDDNIDGAIDSKGRLLFTFPHKNNAYLEGDFHDGLAKVNLYKYWIPERKGVISTTEKDYEGFINLKGEVVFNDTNCVRAKDFSNGRTFISRAERDYILVDKHFNRIGNNEFEQIQSETFKDNLAIVRTSDGWGIIDTTGNFIVAPSFDEIDGIGVVNGFFFFAHENDSNQRLYGISDLKGKILVKPVIQDFDRRGFVDGLIRVIIEDKLTYINKNGNIIWQEQKSNPQILKEMNIDYMNRGYFYAYSSPRNNEDERSGGWATSSNIPKMIADYKFPVNQLSVTIDPNLNDTFAKHYYGIKLFISNTTKDTIKFRAQDSRLYMKLQAQDENGEWKDIEYLPSSWCGNSYHQLSLEPNAFWSFTIPKYNGDILTNIRAELKYLEKGKSKKVKIIYSNSVKGSINKGQFWNKRIYYPSGIMDPYFD